MMNVERLTIPRISRGSRWWAVPWHKRSRSKNGMCLVANNVSCPKGAVWVTRYAHYWTSPCQVMLYLHQEQNVEPLFWNFSRTFSTLWVIVFLDYSGFPVEWKHYLPHWRAIDRKIEHCGYFDKQSCSLWRGVASCQELAQPSHWASFVWYVLAVYSSVLSSLPRCWRVC